MLLLKVWYVREVSKYFQEDTLGIELKCSISGLDTSWEASKYAVAAGSTKLILVHEFSYFI